MCRAAPAAGKHVCGYVGTTDLLDRKNRRKKILISVCGQIGSTYGVESDALRCQGVDGRGGIREVVPKVPEVRPANVWVEGAT